MKKTVAADDLKRFTADVFTRVGMSAAHAEIVADALVWANLRGVDSHGVVRLTRYLEMIEQGLMNVRPVPQVRMPTDSIIQIESDRAPGAVVMTMAVDHLMAQVRTQGIALALIARMTHSGALGYYTQKVAAAGYACIALNAGNPLMPYFGAQGAALGTNPISIAVPGAANEPMIFDMASSAVSLGKLMLARKTGEALPPGSAVDKDGRPTADPAAATMTAPLGGPKGSGLALMIECLTSLLSGHPLVADALQKTGEGARHRQNAMLIAIDVARFIDVSEFRRQVERLVGALKALPAAGPDDILMPGERGYRAAAARSASGIPLSPPVLSELAAIAERLGVEPVA